MLCTHAHTLELEEESINPVKLDRFTSSPQMVQYYFNVLRLTRKHFDGALQVYNQRGRVKVKREGTSRLQAVCYYLGRSASLWLVNKQEDSVTAAG